MRIDASRRRLLTTFAVGVVIALGFYAAVWLQATRAGDGSNPHLFFHPDNVSNILGQAALVGILACGMTLVIVSGHIDLSVGSLLGMLGAVAATLLTQREGPGMSGALVIPFIFVLGAALGFGQGALAAWARIPSFVVTLGGLLVFRGILLILAARTIPVDQPLFNLLGSGTFFGLPVRFVVMMVLAFLLHMLATRFRFGRYLYAIGGNREAARYAGIPVEKHIALTFALMGGIAALAGMVSVGIQQASDAGAGDLLELYAIAACVIGGTSLSGGKGQIFGSVLGALIMAIIRNGLSCLGVPSAGEKIVLGLILVAAVGLDLSLNRQKR